jgi:hypothetical protein
MIRRRHTTAFLRLAVGIKGSDERANDFNLVTIESAFAGPCTVVLEAGTDASYPMLTVRGGPAQLHLPPAESRVRTQFRSIRGHLVSSQFPWEVKFASDSPVEEAGCEPSVPRNRDHGF